MPKYTKQHPISELKDGQRVDDIFVVKIKKAMAPYVKGFAFDLLLSDSSGKSLDYKYWGGADEAKVRRIYGSIKPDSVVRVQGKVTTYQGKLQLATNEPDTITVLRVDEYEPGDFIMPARKDLDKLYSEVMEAVAQVKNPKLKALLEAFFEDNELAEKFKRHPGAIEIHHNWVGGLLEHVLEVLEYCLLSAKMFPTLDKDLLITGALLHDIGKLEEMEVTSRIKRTMQGQRIGHLTLGAIAIAHKMDELNFDKELKAKVLHMMVSHHGTLDNGSPKEPMFPEALTLSQADRMSAKLAEMIEFIEQAKGETEDEFMYHKRLGRNLWLG